VIRHSLFDENAASHVAIGSAYAFTLEGGEAIDTRGVRARRRAGTGAIGSGELDIDGVRAEGTREPVMREGEWAD
jgi:aminopeptidase